MKRRMFALLLALMLAASCCWTGFSEETPCPHTQGENVGTYILNNSSDFEECKKNVAADDAETHSFEWHSFGDVYCQECDELLEAHAVIATGRERNPHTYENSVCTVCGYENACAHTNTQTTTEWGSSQYVPYDSNYHSLYVNEEETVTCMDCRQVVSFKVLQTVTVRAYERHAMWNNECEECGYVNACSHENLTRVEDKSSEYLEQCVSLGEEGHSGKLVKVYAYVCSDCGSDYVKDSEEEHTGKVVTRPHAFSGGMCDVCDYKNTCAHVHQTEKKEDSFNYWCPRDQKAYEGHEVNYSGSKWMECDDCGEELEDTKSFDNDEYTEPHVIQNGMCVLCHFVMECDHPNAYDKDQVENYLVSSDWNMHTVQRVTRHIRRCDDCNTVLSETLGQPEQVTEAHTFADGICSVCGVTEICEEHGEKTIEQVWILYSEDAGEEGHYQRRKLLEHYVCKKCGYAFNDMPSRFVKTLTWFEPHQYEEGSCYTCGHTTTCDQGHQFEFGYCIRCGLENTCVHEHTTTKRVDEYSYYCGAMENDAGHEVRHITGERTVCDDCGDLVLNYIDTNEEEAPEAHQMVDGKCAKCGFIRFCEHKNTEIQEEHEDEVLSKDEQNHTVKRTTYKETVCKDCDELLDAESGEPTDVTEAHKFENGVCTVCGQAASQPTEAPSVQPTEAPSVQPTVAPDVTVAPTAKAEVVVTPAPIAEPVYEEVPAEEPVHGVKAEDKTPMVETLSTVAEALEAEKAQVTIANVEKIVTPEEKTALDQLPLREQMLTVLCAIGFEQQVTEVLAGEGVSLSEEAEALKEQILARIDAMNEEEKAAFQQMLEENFPVETVEMDGVEYRFFVFEVEIETEEGLRRERYGFREEDGAWIFVKLSVAETAK